MRRTLSSVVGTVRRPRICEELEARRALAVSPSFTDASDAIDFPQLGSFSGVAWFDYDNDGNRDVFLANNQRRGGGKLFHNEGDGSFVDMTEQAWISDRLRSSSVVAGDFDNDGNADLLVTWFSWTGTTGATTLYHNKGDGTFEDVSESAGIDPPFTPASMSLADIDGDSYLDLFITATGSFGTMKQYDSRLARSRIEMQWELE